MYYLIVVLIMILINILLTCRDDGIRTHDFLVPNQALYQTEPHPVGNKKWSGREDSNFRPPAPHAGALAKLRYAPLSI